MCLAAQSCSTPGDPMDCRLPGSSVNGHSPGKDTEVVAMPSSRDLPIPGIKRRSPEWQADSLPSEAPGKPTGPLGNPFSSPVFIKTLSSPYNLIRLPHHFSVSHGKHLSQEWMVPAAHSHSLSSSIQSGFCPHHSTKIFLVKVPDEYIKNIGEFSLVSAF